MEIASIQFAALVVIGAALFFIVPRADWRRGVLLGVSCAFLASFGNSISALWPVVLFCAAAVAAIFLAASRRELSIPMLAALAVLFLILKSYIPIGANGTIIVVVGISYILFRTIQLVLDVRDEVIEGDDLNLPDVILFLISFLTLSAGPIQRYQEFRVQLCDALKLNIRDVDFTYVMGRSSLGLLKLIILAPFVQNLYQGALEIDAVSIRLGLAASAFMLWIYVNFSGYMDIVIGVGRIFGFNLPENFNRPDKAVNFLDIWNRWHITLSRTFLTYFFNPLVRFFLGLLPGRPIFAGVLSYLIVFFLIGCWHGPGAQFALSGVMFGLAAASTRAWQSLRQKGAIPVLAVPGAAVVSGGLALGFCAIALIPTWPLFTSASEVLAAFRSPNRLIGVILIAWAAGIAARLVGIVFDEIVRRLSIGEGGFAPFRHPGVVAAVVATLLLAQLSASDQFSAIVYYQRF